jgi:hypothetical protein
MSNQYRFTAALAPLILTLSAFPTFADNAMTGEDIAVAAAYHACMDGALTPAMRVDMWEAAGWTAAADDAAVARVLGELDILFLPYDLTQDDGRKASDRAFRFRELASNRRDPLVMVEEPHATAVYLAHPEVEGLLVEESVDDPGGPARRICSFLLAQDSIAVPKPGVMARIGMATMDRYTGSFQVIVDMAFQARDSGGTIWSVRISNRSVDLDAISAAIGRSFRTTTVTTIDLNREDQP